MEFVKYPKTPRLFRDIVVTEKLDGTNSAIHILAITPEERVPHAVEVDGTLYAIQAQSRNRLIYPLKGADNHGFAAWVEEHAVDLVRLLGEGTHFGEWWGHGIARNYGLDHRRFSLFNVERYGHLPSGATELDVYTVPVLYEGPFDLGAVRRVVDELRTNGSVAVPGFKKPEGVCVFHTASRQVYKVLVENDELPKSLVQ